jgi:hypothetical protein
VALMRVYCGLAASEQLGTPTGNGWLTAAVVDDAGRLLDVCDIGDDATGYAELGALLAERSGGPNSVAVAADSDEHHVTLLLAAAGRPLAIVDDELLTDYADRFGDDDSSDELDAGPSERAAVGLARALAAGALAASSQSAPRELMALKPVLAAHAAMAAGRHGTAVALREVLRELYPAALRAYPDPAEPIPLAILDALPEPGLLGGTVAGRGRDANVTDQLAAAGIADAGTISDALTALRLAIAETPRRTGIGKGTTTAVAQTIREAVAAVRACDAAISALVGLLSDKGASAPIPVPAARPAPVAELPRPPARRGRPARDVEPPATVPLRPTVRLPAARPATSRPAARVAPAQPVADATPAPAQIPVPAPQPVQSQPMQSQPIQPIRPQPAQPQPVQQPIPQPPVQQPRVAPQPAAAAAHVPPPPPGITPMPPSSPLVQRDRGVGNAPQPNSAPVTPMWSAEPVISYTQAGPVAATPPPPTAYERYAEPPQAGPYTFDTGYDAPTYPLAPEVPAPGSRDTWPINPPSYDDDAVRARNGSFSYQEAPVASEAPIPRQRDGRVSPPWQDDMQMPAEPPSLRLVDRDRDLAGPTAPVLRLVGNDELRSYPRPETDRDQRPYIPEQRPSSVDESDGDLLIFAQARSAWFEWPAEEEPVDERPAWADIDAGWSVAARAEHPEVEDHTEIGLPRRVPQANLVPGSPLPPMADEGLRIVRDPASMAAHTTGYFRGSRRGEEVRGYAVGGRSGLESGGGWDFSRDGWDSDRDTGYRSAAHR